MEGTDDEHAVSNRSNLTALKVAISNPVMPPYPDLAMCNDMSPEEKAQIQWCNGHTFRHV
jgi:hypothetical protein